MFRVDMAQHFNFEKKDFEYSLKNIAEPSKKQYLLALIDKTRKFVYRVRWRLTSTRSSLSGTLRRSAKRAQMTWRILTDQLPRAMFIVFTLRFNSTIFSRDRPKL